MEKNNNTTIHQSCPFFILMTPTNTMLFNKALSSQVLLFRINSNRVSKIKSLCSLWFHNKVEFIFLLCFENKKAPASHVQSRYRPNSSCVRRQESPCHFSVFTPFSPSVSIKITSWSVSTGWYQMILSSADCCRNLQKEADLRLASKESWLERP